MSIKILKLLSTTENILGIYRNYSLLSKLKKFLIWFQILIEIIVVSCSFKFLRQILAVNLKIQVYIIITYMICSLSMIMLSLYHSRNYIKVTRSIKSSHQRFIHDKIYLRNLSRNYKMLIFVIIFYVSMMIVLEFYVFTSYYFKLTSTDGLNVVYFIYMIICNLRFSFQFVVAYSFSMLLSEHVKCIAREISKEKNLKSIITEDEDTNTIEVIPQYITSFDEWTTVYTNIKECSDLINVVFGVEVGTFYGVNFFEYLKL